MIGRTIGLFLVCLASVFILASCGGDASTTTPQPQKCSGQTNPMLDCRLLGCDADETCLPDESVCLPSACSCIEETGQWVCTDDCGAGYSCQVKAQCSGENPATDCRTTGCDDDDECVLDPNACKPSHCACDETGTWMCTADCGEGYVCTDAPSGGECADPDPSIDCRTTGCDGEGEECLLEPGGCLSSSCFCTDGSWACTDDCGELHTCQVPLTCDGPDPSLDCRDTGCEDDKECRVDPAGCLPSSCFCEPEGWICTEDCNELHTCQDPEPACEGPNPAGCAQERCEEGFVCRKDTDECAPSHCICDENGEWGCTRDCAGGGVCVPTPTECEGPNPAGCAQEGCPEGQTCEPTDECAPSVCSCTDGLWICTRDCGGGGVCR